MAAEDAPRVLPSASTPIRHRKAAEVIAEELRRSIVQDGRTGDYLPSEKHLIEQFQVSRPTLREALRVLESEGLVEIRRGIRGGAVVREPAIDELALRFGVFLQLRNTTLEDLFMVRKILEPAAARLAAEAVGRGTPPTLLENMLEAEAAAIAAMQEARQLGATLVDFHDGVLELAGSTTLSVVWKLLDKVVGPYTFTSLQSFGDREARLEAVKRSHASHKALTKAITAGDADKAERIMRVHLDAVRDATRSVVQNRMVDVFADSGQDRQDASAPDAEAEAPPASKNGGRPRRTGARPRS